MNKIVQGAQEALDFIKQINASEDVAFRLRKWAEVLAIPSGKFVNQDMQHAADELDRLHSILRGVECALARDGDIDAAMRLITNGKQGGGAP